MKIEFDMACLNPAQRRFVLSPSKQVLLAGGFGSGKTTALAVKILILKSENQGVDGLVVAQTFGSIEAVVLASIWDIFRKSDVPEEFWPRHRGRGTGKDWLDFGDGDKVHLRSAETPKGMDGLNVGWLCGDEIRHWSKNAYDVALGRRRQDCPLPQSCFASTPAMHWMADEFNTDKDDRELIVAPTVENASNLVDGFVDNLRKSYSPRMQRAVLDGEFTILEGAVFEEFDPNPKTSEWMVDFKCGIDNVRRHRVFLAADPGYRRSAWIWIAEIGKMEWVIFDQAMLDNCSDEMACQVINEKGWPIDEVWIDPAAGNTQSAFAIDTLRVLRQGIKTRGPRPFRSVSDFRDIRFGIDKLRVLLGGYQDLPKRIRFARSMAERDQSKPRGIIRDLGALRYPEVKDGRPVSDAPLKDGMTDHSCLVGSTKVWTDDSGWEEISKLNGSQARILTPCGLRRISILGKTRTQAPVWEVCLASGKKIVATGDHPFIVSARCRCGRMLSDFSWQTVLQMRSLLQQTGRQNAFIPAQGGVYRNPWGSGCKACAPHRREQIKQQPIEPYGDGGAQPPIVACKTITKEVFEESQRRGGSLAQIARRQAMAQEARQSIMGKPQAAGLYLPTMWQALSVAENRRGEILPPELQGNGASPTHGHQAYQEVVSIRKAGTSDVWCASVPDAGCFAIDDGVISSNTDALRYFAVSRWLNEPELRKVDPQLRYAGAGYKIHFHG